VNNVYLQKEIKDAVFSLKNKISPSLDLDSEILIEKEKSKTELITTVQNLYLFKSSNPLEQRIFELILSYAVDSEKKYPGSFSLVIKDIFKIFEKIVMGISIRNNLENFQQPLLTTPASIFDLNELIVDRINEKNSMIASLFYEAIQLAGFGGRIFVEKTHSQTPSLELTCGYSFDLKPAWPCNIKLQNVKTFIIDGFIESVSEIHHLLEKQSSAKDVSLLFARGLSQDVISTLKVNFERGTLKCIPIIAPFDLEGINILNDIAVIAGSDVVSSNKGNLISSISYDGVPIISFVMIYPNKIILQHSTTARAVSVHSLNLKNKRLENSAIEDVYTLFDKRIRSLSPSSVIIRLPDDKNFIVNSQLIDFGLRSLKTFIDYGLFFDEKNKMPATCFFAGIFASKCVNQIIKVGAAILDDL
jgi:hypothetical protein